MPSDVRLTTGQSSFEYGVDSSRVPLIQSQGNPKGLPRNALAWLINGTTRGGGITPRNGYIQLCKVGDGSQIYQGGWLYDNSLLGGNPYLMLCIGGRMIQVRVDTNNSVVDVTNGFLDTNVTPKAYFCQEGQFMVKQAGDGFTLPLFWDGVTLRRSFGTSKQVGTTAAPFTVSAVGFNNVVTLAAPYAGTVNQFVLINGKQYIQVIPDNFYTIKNLSSPAVGATIPAGTTLAFPNGTVVGKLLASFIVPAIGATVNVKVTPKYVGPGLPTPITLNGDNYEIDTVGTVAPGANQVYLVNLNDTPGTVIPTSTVLLSVQELPQATSMISYMGRIWYAQGRTYTAGDITGNTSSGSLAYNFTDSVLKVTENPLAVGGDGFRVPSQSGNIRALNYPIALDTALGQGPLFVFTPKQVYALTVPVSRADWIAAGSNNQPLQRVIMRSNGTVSDRSVVSVNGDLFYQSLDPAIRSYFMALRYFQTWGNSPISNNINRALQFSDRSLMHMASGMEFKNRVYQTILPVQTTVGVAFQHLAVLDTDPIGTLQDQRPPVWDGTHTGLDILQVFSGDFGGRERAFAVVHSQVDGGIWVWEITDDKRFDRENTDSEERVEMWFETPAFDFSDVGSNPYMIKELDGLDLWLDRVFGEVLIKVQFRTDEDPCWYDWDTTKVCAARKCSENPDTPACYPTQKNRELYRMPISFPKPTNQDCSVGNDRPVTWGGKFQLKITITGWARVRGFQLHALPKDTGPFYHQIC